MSLSGMARLAAERAGELPGMLPCPKCEFTIGDEACANRQELLVTLNQHHACIGPGCPRWSGREYKLTAVNAAGGEVPLPPAPEPGPDYTPEEDPDGKEEDEMVEKAKCQGCGVEVWPGSTWCRKCSAKHRGNSGNGPGRPKDGPAPVNPEQVCADCGAPVSTAKTRRCNPCARKYRWGPALAERNAAMDEYREELVKVKATARRAAAPERGDVEEVAALLALCGDAQRLADSLVGLALSALGRVNRRGGGG